MATETTFWICDSCGGRVKSPEDGWVEWLRRLEKPSGKSTGRDLRLVHHLPASPMASPPGCQFNQEWEHDGDGSIVSDRPLTDFLGPDGLMRLLLMLSEGSVPSPEVLEMIKRLHVAGYEAARPHFDQAIDAGVFEPNTPHGFYSQNDIEATLEFVERARGA